MQAETQLVPLPTRVQQIVACRLAKTLHRGWESMALTRLCRVLPQWRDMVTGNTLLRRVADTAKHLLGYHNLSLLLQDEPDRPAAFYGAPSPWQAPPAAVIITDLPVSKALCTRGELQQHVLQTVAQAGIPGTASAV